MYKKWFENYQELAFRSRWVSVFGASVLALFMVAEMVGTILTVLSFEAGVGQAIRLIGFEELFPSLIFLLVISRILAFTMKSGSHYKVGVIAWSIIAIIILAILTMEVLAELIREPPPQCVSTPDKICFSFYDMRRAPVSPLATLIYVVAGCVKSATIGLIAFFRSKSKLK